MDYYLVIIVFVVLKILFWTFFFYMRAQRIRAARAQQRIVVVERRITRPATVHRPEDQASIIGNETIPHGYNNLAGQQQLTLPPSYNEVVTQDPSHFQKPPSYEQVVKNTVVSENTT